MALHFVPYDQSSNVPNIIVDGPANAGTVLTLSHWSGSRTPDSLRADTSAEIVFNYLEDSGFHVETEAVSNNHFDQDGLIGVFAITQAETARKYRDLLIDAAQAGDFGTYKDRNAARIAFVISAYSVPKSSPLPKSIFKLPYPQLASELYRAVLPIMPRMLAGISEFQEFWEKEDRELTASENLIEAGEITVEERPELDLAIFRMPETSSVECHPMAIHNRTDCLRILKIKGERVDFQYRYETWVRLASKHPALRIDLSALAGELNRMESDAQWIFEGADQIIPRLYRKGTISERISPSLFLELLKRELSTGAPAWDPYR